MDRIRNLLAAPSSEPKAIGILGFDGVATLDLAGPLKAFTTARTDADTERPRSCYDVGIIGLKAKSFVSDSNLVVTGTESLAKARHFDTVLVPGGPGLRDNDTTRTISEWLKANADDLNRIVSIGTGIYAVAQSGLLAGRKVATHWRSAQDVARRFPNLRVDQTASFLKDGPFYSCAGGTAAAELTLALIEEDYGSRVALSVARELCLSLRPFGDHADALDPVQFECGPNDRLAELPTWIAGHLNQDLSVEALAGRTCLCPRHFSRLFKRAFRSSPANFVEALRLDEAKRQLLRARGSVESIAVAIGFRDSDSFRRAFKRHVGLSPAAFRRQRFAVVVKRKATSNRYSAKISVMPGKGLSGHKSAGRSKPAKLRGARGF